MNNIIENYINSTEKFIKKKKKAKPSGYFVFALANDKHFLFDREAAFQFVHRLDASLAKLTLDAHRQDYFDVWDQMAFQKSFDVVDNYYSLVARFDLYSYCFDYGPLK